MSLKLASDTTDDFIDAPDCLREPKCKIPPEGKHSDFLCYLGEMDPVEDMSFQGLKPDQTIEEYIREAKEARRSVRKSHARRWSSS